MNGFGESPISSSAPPGTSDKEVSSKNFGSSANDLCFGFVATAILITIFLIMAIFEHLLRPRSSLLRSRNDTQRSLQIGQAQDQMHSFQKLKNWRAVTAPITTNLSVVMPGQQYPTFLAQTAPLPCPREEICWPSHDHYAFGSPIS